MLKLWLRKFLFPQEILSLEASLIREQALLQQIQSLSSLLEQLSNKRLTLEDLQMRPGEEQTLKSCSKDFRMALWKAGEHKCVTTFPECCRKTAIEMREYYRILTLSLANKVPDLDMTR